MNCDQDRYQLLHVPLLPLPTLALLQLQEESEEVLDDADEEDLRLAAAGAAVAEFRQARGPNNYRQQQQVQPPPPLPRADAQPPPPAANQPPPQPPPAANQQQRVQLSSNQSSKTEVNYGLEALAGPFGQQVAKATVMRAELSTQPEAVPRVQEDGEAVLLRFTQFL